jgi:PAS domain-containing protein
MAHWDAEQGDPPGVVLATGGGGIFRSVFEAALDAFILADATGLVVDANPAAAELFGRRREQIVGHRVTPFLVTATDIPTGRGGPSSRSCRRTSPRGSASRCSAT